MYCVESQRQDICGFCSSFYKDKRHDDFLLFGVCGNTESQKLLVKYGETACNSFNDGIKTIIEKCFKAGVEL